MIICPECEAEQTDLKFTTCTSCSTSMDTIKGVPRLLSNKDKASPLFSDYKDNYDQISKDDLEKSILDKYYLDIQADKMFSYLPQKKGLDICEIGVGQGLLLKKLATLNPKSLTGVDIAVNYLAELVKKGAPFTPVCSNAENLPYKNKFDLVVSTDVLEHVINVGNYLHCIHRSLKKGGTFAVRVPYLEDYSCYSRFNGCQYDFVHLRNFSKSSLKAILEGSGFKVKKIHYDGFIFSKFRFCDSLWGIPFRLLRKIIYLALNQDIKKVAKMPNFLGRILMPPLEITAICEK